MAAQASLMNDRTNEAEHALRILGRDRFEAFVRAIRNDTRCTAVRLMNERLDAGTEPETVLLTGGRFGFSLAVSPLGPLRYRIAFGCLAAPLAGDGGEWDVEFDEQNGVLRVEPGISWMAKRSPRH